MADILTFGYQGLKMDRIVETMQRRKAVVLDVRFSPYSPFAGWRKEAFKAALGDQYQWVKGFGNVNYKSGGIRLYDEQAGLRAIALLGKVPGVEALALMCACADVATCHRRHVANVVQDFLGWPLHHLTFQDIMGVAQKAPTEATLRRHARELAKKQQSSLFADDEGKGFRHRDDS